MDQLEINILKEGEGEEIVSGKVAEVHYDGMLTNGTVFDSSRRRGQTFSFMLGAGQVIQGWDKGVVGMKVGEVRRLTIPPSMGYGEIGVHGVIPGGSVLVFEVELVGIA